MTKYVIQLYAMPEFEMNFPIYIQGTGFCSSLQGAINIINAHAVLAGKKSDNFTYVILKYVDDIMTGVIGPFNKANKWLGYFNPEEGYNV